MMASVKTLPFHIVDVFAVEPLTGNPLAVVDGGIGLTLDQFQRIAREFNQSETTFVLPPTRPQADWRLRSFTAAGVEVFGAGGHNSLGAWWWLAEAGKLALTGNATVFHQEIGDRVLPVTISRVEGRLSGVVMDQEPPVAGSQLNDVAMLAASIGLTIADLAVDRVPCQVISTGVGRPPGRSSGRTWPHRRGARDSGGARNSHGPHERDQCRGVGRHRKSFGTRRGRGQRPVDPVAGPVQSIFGRPASAHRY